jgi:hypothetical protein
MRLVRIVKSVPPLYDLVKGMASALHGISWVIVLTFLVLYMFALLAVKLIGEGLAFSELPPESVREPFHALFDTFFVLFQVMNGDQSVLEPLFEHAPLSKFIFVVFMIMTNWSILSILTAVVSENMIKVTEHNEKERAEVERQRREERQYDRLMEIFASLDKDGSGDLDLTEFKRILDDNNSTTRDELCDTANMNANDLVKIFDYLSREPATGGGNPRVPRWYFVDGLRHESAPPTERSIMRLEKQIARVENMIAETTGGGGGGTPERTPREPQRSTLAHQLTGAASHEHT